MERPPPAPAADLAISLFGGADSGLVRHGEIGVQMRIRLADALEDRAGDLDRGEFFRANPRRELRQGEKAKGFRVHAMLQSGAIDRAFSTSDSDPKKPRDTLWISAQAISVVLNGVRAVKNPGILCFAQSL